MATAKGFMAVMGVISLLCIPVPAAAQNPPPSGDAIIEDDPGDVIFDATATSRAASASYDHVDILRAWLGEETVETVSVGIEVKTLTPPDQTSSLGGTPDYTVFFRFADSQYRAIAQSYGSPNAGFALQRFNDALDVFQVVTHLTPDVRENRLSFRIPKDSLLDANHTPPTKGSEITNIYATADLQAVPYPRIGAGTIGTPDELVTARDRAPDTEFGPDFVVRQAKSEHNGHLRLASASPLRVSNGGAATNIVFKAVFLNEDKEADTALLEAVDVRSDWSVRTPPRVTVPGSGSVEIPVILTTDAGHHHGETATFLLQAVSLRDPNVNASLRLGVFWTDTPQPAGHHHDLWLHSRDDGLLWINTLQDDAASGATEAPASYSGFSTSDFQNTNYEWALPLSPRLILGVDLRADRKGTAHLEFTTLGPAQNAHVEASLDYCDPEATQDPNGGGNGNSFQFGGSYPCPGSWLPVLRASSPVAAVGAGATPAYDLEFTPVGDKLYFPFKPGSNLGLRVRFASDLPQGLFPDFGPVAFPSVDLNVRPSRLSLPLVEYSDPVEQALLENTDLSLRVEGSAERNANPGRTSVFTFELENRGQIERRLALDLDGYHKEWARIAGADTFRLAPGEKRDVLVAVSVPDGAQPGETAELVLLVTEFSNPSSITFARARLQVVTEPSIPDESKLLPASAGGPKGTPGPGVALLCLALAALAAAVRRR